MIHDWEQRYENVRLQNVILRQQREALLAILRCIEWAVPCDDCSDGATPFCASCGEWEKHGHDSSCELAAALGTASAGEGKK
jgi:hypothetical protein